MNILIAGGSGFLGKKIVSLLKEHSFINLSKNNPNTDCLNNINLDLSMSFNNINLSFSSKVDMVINCIDTNAKKDEEIRKNIVEGTKNLLDLAKQNNIPRIIHLSINEPEAIKDEYQKSKLLAERAVENSGIEYVILRLSPVFGDGSQLERLLSTIMQKERIAQIGSEEDTIAPIHYTDVVRNIKQAFIEDSVWNQSFSLCGPEYMTFNEFISRYAPKQLKVYKVPKIIEKVFVGAISDDFTKRLLYTITNSYYQDSKYIHSQIVKPLKFY